jgi:hypothetical protein
LIKIAPVVKKIVKCQLFFAKKLARKKLSENLSASFPEQATHTIKISQWCKKKLKKLLSGKHLLIFLQKSLQKKASV